MGRRETLARPRTLRRRYDPKSQRIIFAPSRPNKRCREEIAEIDAESAHRTNQIGGGYQPIENVEEEPQAPEEGEVQTDQNTLDTEEDNVIKRSDNLPIVDLSK